MPNLEIRFTQTMFVNKIPNLEIWFTQTMFVNKIPNLEIRFTQTMKFKILPSDALLPHFSIQEDELGKRMANIKNFRILFKILLFILPVR